MLYGGREMFRVCRSCCELSATAVAAVVSGGGLAVLLLGLVDLASRAGGADGDIAVVLSRTLTHAGTNASASAAASAVVTTAGGESGDKATGGGAPTANAASVRARANLDMAANPNRKKKFR